MLELSIETGAVVRRCGTQAGAQLLKKAGFEAARKMLKESKNKNKKSK